MKKNGLVVFAGNSNLDLAKEVCKTLDIALGNALVTTFSDGENRVQIQENVRGRDAFIIQSLSNPVNNNLMELLLLIDALKRASAYRITAVIPYYGYSRQDRKDQPRVPITAKLVADLLTTAGANRILTMELHAGQIQGFFNIPVDHLYAAPVFLKYFNAQDNNNLVVVSPDAGGVERARALAKRLGVNLAIIDKRRDAPNQSEVMHIIGDVNGKNVLLLDDMIDTAGTVSQAAKAIKKEGGLSIAGCCTHGVFSGPAIERLNNAPFDEIVVTNTIQLKQGTSCSKIKVLSIAPLFGEAIARIHKEESVNSLFV